MVPALRYVEDLPRLLAADRGVLREPRPRRQVLLLPLLAARCVEAFWPTPGVVGPSCAVLGRAARSSAARQLRRDRLIRVVLEKGGFAGGREDPDLLPEEEVQPRLVVEVVFFSFLN